MLSRELQSRVIVHTSSNVVYNIHIDIENLRKPKNLTFDLQEEAFFIF